MKFYYGSGINIGLSFFYLIILIFKKKQIKINLKFNHKNKEAN